MSYLFICAVALLASILSFYSGFGLGTLLLPAFALFFSITQAVVLTAVVHFLNNLFKLALVGKHADWRVVVRFGVPAIPMSFVGAWLLVWLSDIPAVFSYTAFDTQFSATPIELVVGVLLLAFASLELFPRFRNLSFGSRSMPLGGLLTGFFGGLSGMQGAIRSAFLVRAGLTKEAFIGTGVVLACIIDVARLAIYSRLLADWGERLHYGLLTAAVLAAFVGATLGNRYLKKVTFLGIQRTVAVMLFIVAVGLVFGLL